MAGADRPSTFGDVAPSRYPGERLGLPEHGAHSIARFPRRIVAILIDWVIALAASAWLFDRNPWATLAVFVVLQIVFVPTVGGSIGHRLMGLRVVAIAGGWVGVWRPALRAVLLGLVVPAVVWDSDQRGFHDKAAGTALLLVRAPHR